MKQLRSVTELSVREVDSLTFGAVRVKQRSLIAYRVGVGLVGGRSSLSLEVLVTVLRLYYEPISTLVPWNTSLNDNANAIPGLVDEVGRTHARRRRRRRPPPCDRFRAT